MDERIVDSRGTYLDRNEFVAEAIWDRLNEDATRQGSAVPATEPTLATSTVTHDPPSPARTHLEGADRQTGNDVDGEPDETPIHEPLPLGEIVAHRGGVPTLPRQTSGGTIFGLHNRDLPTVWIVTHLALMAAADGGPVPWVTFVNRLRTEAQQTGALLREVDKRELPAVKSSIGFPKSGVKARASEDRLITTALGAPSRTGVTGPALLLGLVATSNPTESRPALAPTPEAIDLLADLADAGFGISLPQPEAACRLWLRFIANSAPEEHDAWFSVLRVLSEKPTRSELVERFPHWTGSTADTNTTGYVSRGREWGLVTPELADGRYLLTSFGEQIVTEGTLR
jgi:hypothetical protein